MGAERLVHRVHLISWIYGCRKTSAQCTLSVGYLNQAIEPTLELFQGQHWGNSLETGWSAYGLSESIDIPP